METAGPPAHEVSVVIPVYQGERTLGRVVDELAASRRASGRRPRGRPYRVTEVVLVHDCGPDASDDDDPRARGDATTGCARSG